MGTYRFGPRGIEDVDGECFQRNICHKAAAKAYKELKKAVDNKPFYTDEMRRQLAIRSLRTRRVALDRGIWWLESDIGYHSTLAEMMRRGDVGNWPPLAFSSTCEVGESSHLLGATMEEEVESSPAPQEQNLELDAQSEHPVGSENNVNWVDEDEDPEDPGTPQAPEEYVVKSRSDSEASVNWLGK